MGIDEEKTIIYKPEKENKPSGVQESAAVKSAVQTPPVRSSGTGGVPRVPEFRPAAPATKQLPMNASGTGGVPRVPEFRPAAPASQQLPMNAAGTGGVPRVPEFRQAAPASKQLPMNAVGTGGVPRVPEFRPARQQIPQQPPVQQASQRETVNAFGTGNFQAVQPNNFQQQSTGNNQMFGVPEFRPAQPQPAWQQPVQQSPRQAAVNAYGTGGFRPLQPGDAQKSGSNSQAFGVPEFRPMQQPGWNNGHPLKQQQAYLQGKSGFGAGRQTGSIRWQDSAVVRAAGDGLKHFVTLIIANKRVALIVAAVILALFGVVSITGGSKNGGNSNGNVSANGNANVSVKSGSNSGGIVNQEIVDLVNRFNAAYTGGDMYGLADCIDPTATKVISKTKELQKKADKGWDLQYYAGEGMTYTPYDFEQNGDQGTVYLHGQHHIKGESQEFKDMTIYAAANDHVLNDVATVIRINGQWYFTADQKTDSLYIRKVFNYLKYY